MDNCEKVSTNKGGIQCRYLMSMIQKFDDDKHHAYRGEDFLKKFEEFLREHTVKIVNFKKKKMIQLRNKQQHWYEKTKSFYI